MKYSAAVALFAASAMATKTVYQTELETITSCGPEVTNCPARSSTAVPAVSTAVPSVPAMGTPSPAPSAPASSGVEGATSPIMTTSTVYSTLVSSGSEGLVTKTVIIGTTICPVSEAGTPTPSAPAAGSPSGPAAAGTPSAAVPVAPASSGVEGSSPSAPASAPPAAGTGGAMPYPTGGPYASTMVHSSPAIPVAPTVPAGTPAGSPASTPMATPPSFTGAASSMNAGAAFAGLGAIAAFFF